MKFGKMVYLCLIVITTILCGCQSIEDQRQSMAHDNKANLCALQTEGTTFKSLIDAARGKKLHLVRVLNGEQALPPFAANQQLMVTSSGEATASDGCNIISFEANTSPKLTAGNPFFQHFEPFTTLKYCPEKAEFPLLRVYRFQQCGEEYWLYYDQPSAVQPKIMVFAPRQPTTTQPEAVNPAVAVGRAFGLLPNLPSFRVRITSTEPLISFTLPITQTQTYHGEPFTTIVDVTKGGYRVATGNREYLWAVDEYGDSPSWYVRDEERWQYAGLNPKDAPGLPFVPMLWAGPYAQQFGPIPGRSFQTNALGSAELNGSQTEQYQVDRLGLGADQQPQLDESTLVWIDPTTDLPLKSERIYPEKRLTLHFDYSNVPTITLPSPLTDAVFSASLPVLPAPLYYLDMAGDIWLMEQPSRRRHKLIDEVCPILDFDIANHQEKLVYSTGIALVESDLVSSVRWNIAESVPSTELPGAASSCIAETPISVTRYSPDGTQIAYILGGVRLVASGNEMNTDIQLLPNIRWEVDTHDVNNIRIYRALDWSPDGSYLALYTAVWETGGIELYNLTTNQLQMIHSLIKPDIHLCCNWQWGSESQVGFVTDGGFYRSFDQGIYRVDVTTAAVTQLKSGIPDYGAHRQKSVFAAKPSTDGTLVAFVVDADDQHSLENPRYRLQRIDMNGGASIPLQQVALPLAGEVLWAANGEGAAVMTTKLSAIEEPLKGIFVWVAQDGTIYDLHLHGSHLRWGDKIK